MEIYRVRISRVDDLGDLVRVYYFDKPAGFDWDEGAHVHLGLPGFDAGEKRDKSLVRHMSILTLVEEDTVGVITRLDSSDSRYKLMIAGMHLPFPGLGHIRQAKEGYAWVPAEFSPLPASK